MSAAEEIILEEIQRPAPSRRANDGEDEGADDGRADDDRAVIQITMETHEVADAAIRALELDPDLYERSGALVRVLPATEATDPRKGKARLAAGSPTIDRLPMATLRERMGRAARFERFDKRTGEWSRCLPSPMLAETVYARGQWHGIRRLVGVLEAPSLRPDGSIIQAPGYDAATGYLYKPSERFDAVSDAPTQAAARAAMAELVDVFADFPFRDDASRMVPIAALLTLLARPAIEGAAPGFLVDASTPGTGKTLLLDVVATIATGRSAGRMTFPTGRSRDEELEKVLASFALQGAVLVNFDNIADGIGGAALDKVLTAQDDTDFRVLGKSEVRKMPWLAVIVASGNNVCVLGDTSRRMLTGRLESPLENPEDRTGFKHPHLAAWVRAQRPRLVRAALTVLRGFFVAGCPRSGCGEWGSFEAWAALVPPAIVWAGGADVLAARATSAAVEDPDKAAHRAILAGLPRLGQGQAMKVADMIAALYPPERQRGAPMPPDGFDDLREAFEGLTGTPPGRVPGAKHVGNQLRRFLKRVVGEQCLETKRDRKGFATWHVV